jgi:AcrR family transcriptional regulator
LKKKGATFRKLQAKKTKRRIFHSAISLIDDHGYNNVTIEDISSKAGVSVGAFYHYYNSKSDILVELYAEIDHYYEETVAPLIQGDDAFGNIRVFLENYAKYQIKRGLDHVKLLISMQPALFIEESRYMYALFLDVVERGQREGVITKKFTAEYIRDYYFVFARGILLDWSLNDGSYDIKEKISEYTDVLKGVFTAH